MGCLSVPISSDQLRSSSLGYYIPDGTLICNGQTINSRHIDQNANHQKSRMSVHFYTGSALLVLLVAASKHKHLDLTQTMLAWLDGFRIRAAYGMARKKKLQGSIWDMEIPLDKGCARGILCPVKDYIDTRRSTTIVMYVVNRTIFRECQEGEQMRGSMPRQWWWEQELGLDA